MTSEGRPFWGGEYKPWNFQEFHPKIERLEMHIVHFQGGVGIPGQQKTERNYTQVRFSDERGPRKRTKMAPCRGLKWQADEDC